MDGIRLNQLEQAVLAQFLESEGFGKPKKDLTQVAVAHREYTGAGFFTELAAGELPVGDFSRNFTGGKVGAKINASIEVGFVIYVKNGYVDAIEGYTYENGWPSEIKNFDLFLISYTN